MKTIEFRIHYKYDQFNETQYRKNPIEPIANVHRLPLYSGLKSREIRFHIHYMQVTLADVLWDLGFFQVS